MLQTVIVIALIGAAVGYLVYVVARGVQGKRTACGGCGTCPSSAAGAKDNLVQLDASSRSGQASPPRSGHSAVSSPRT